VKRVADIVSEIASASREQSESIQQVDGMVTQMEAMTQKNASLVDESTASLSAVDGQVENMMKVVSFFDVGEVGARGMQATLAERVSALSEPSADMRSRLARGPWQAEPYAQIRDRSPESHSAKPASHRTPNNDESSYAR
jgi:methyl-accepting chemotaxis protein